MKPKITLLVTKGDHLNIAYHYLKDDFNIQYIVAEEPLSKKKMLEYRIKVLGVVPVIGQVLFIIFSKLLSSLSKKRVDELKHSLGISFSEVPAEKLIEVNSVNSVACRKALKKANSDFIFVIGTRIIGKKTLSCVNIPFVNAHAGITPKYRGVHGGYWALANNDIENCGVTLHYVDVGVDTGDIIAQELIHPTKKDNFITYPLLQQEAGLRLLINHSENILDRKPGYSREDLPSKQWFHPTLWGYLVTWISKGVS